MNSNEKQLQHQSFVRVFTISYVFFNIRNTQHDYQSTFAQNSTNISDIQPESNSTANGSVTTPIPRGLWDIQSSGLHGTLNITSIDTQGELQGSIRFIHLNRLIRPSKDIMIKMAI